MKILKKKFYVALIGYFADNSQLEFNDEQDDCVWGYFKLSVNPEYQRVVKKKEVDVICCIRRYETQTRCLKKYFKNKNSSILLVGFLELNDYQDENKDSILIEAISMTFLRNRTKLVFD